MGAQIAFCWLCVIFIGGLTILAWITPLKGLHVMSFFAALVFAIVFNPWMALLSPLNAEAQLDSDAVKWHAREQFVAWPSCAVLALSVFGFLRYAAGSDLDHVPKRPEHSRSRNSESRRIKDKPDH